MIISNSIKKVARYKSYVVRILSYLSLGTYLMVLHDKSPNLYWFVGLSSVTACVVLGLGFIDYHWGFFEAEQEHTGKKNPYLMKVLANQEIIMERLNDSERNN